MMDPIVVPNLDQYFLDAIAAIDAFIRANPYTTSALVIVIDRIVKWTPWSADDRIWQKLKSRFSLSGKTEKSGPDIN